jgi:hypothetical protein
MKISITPLKGVLEMKDYLIANGRRALFVMVVLLQQQLFMNRH